jgi:hypothetical protein
MKLPEKVRPGDPVRADDFNAMVDFMRSLMIQPGVGYRRKHTPAGTVLTIPRRGSWQDESGDLAPFAVAAISQGTDGEDPPAEGWNVTLEPGRVVSMNPAAAANSGNGVDYKIPTIGGTAMDENDVETGERPVVFVPEGGYIYCTIERTGEGILTGTPTIAAESAAVTDSAHYQPGDADAAGDPEQYQKRRLCQISADPDDETQAVIKYWQKSDIEIGPILQQAKNVGGSGSDAYKGWDAEEQRLEFYRTLGEYGLEDFLEDDVVKLRFDAENIGDGETGFAAKIYEEPDLTDPVDPTKKAKFRSLGQGEQGDERQIRIVQDGDIVRITGNGVNRTITFVDCDATVIAELVWEDGLLTGSGDVTMTLGDCAGSSGP